MIYSAEQIAAFLENANLSKIERATGVSRNTLRKIKHGDVGAITYSTIETLSSFMEKALGK